MKPIVLISIAMGLFGLGFSSNTLAGKKSKKPPAPLNQKVKYEAYPNTDIAMVTYLTSRQEFRVGHRNGQNRRAAAPQRDQCVFGREGDARIHRGR